MKLGLIFTSLCGLIIIATCSCFVIWVLVMIDVNDKFQSHEMVRAFEF